MRKPASDVVGLEDVSTSVYQSQLAPGTDIHKVTKDGIYPLGWTYINFIDSRYHWGTLQVINNNAVITHIARLESSIWFESCSGSPAQWNPWHKLSFDDEVAHLSGANNFDTVPTVDNNPLLLANSLPSDLARTGQDTNFTGKLQKSGIDVATVNQLPVADDSGWVAFPSNSNLYLNAYYKIFNGVLYTMGTAEPKNTNGTTEKILNVQSIISYRGYNSLSNDIQYH